MITFMEWVQARIAELPIEEKKWIQGAVDPEHEGFCTPMTKKTCTPRRKALARRFKKGDIHQDNLKKNKKKKKK